MDSGGLWDGAWQSDVYAACVFLREENFLPASARARGSSREHEVRYKTVCKALTEFHLSCASA
jgi:hypothetical protein